MDNSGMQQTQDVKQFKSTYCENVIPTDAYGGDRRALHQGRGNAGRSPGESGTVFLALWATSATLWSLAKPLL